MTIEDIKTLGFVKTDLYYTLSYSHKIYKIVLTPCLLLSVRERIASQDTHILIDGETYSLFDQSSREYITLAQMAEKLYKCGIEEGICKAHDAWDKTLSEVEEKLGINA